jgi:hypothetical protein
VNHLLFGCVLAITSSATATAENVSPADAISAFYRVHQQSTQDGVPNAAQLAKYEPTISPALDRLLQDGEAAEVRFARANPGSPPMIEGDLFSPNFEGISTFKIDSCSIKATIAQCKMQLHFATAHPRPQDKPVDWTDTVSLIQANGGWRVDDIAFGGHWDFGNHGTLKGTLKDMIANAGR